MPFKPEQREYRSVFGGSFGASKEESDAGKYVIEGYATTFDAPYDFYAGWKECIRSTALAGADMSDVILQLNHEGAPLARLRNNSLELSCDEHGLHVRASLNGSACAREQYEAIANGLIDRMSWGFTIADDGIEYDEENRISYITKINKVFDVSIVSLPANEDTEIHARSYLNGVIEKEHQELMLREKESRRRKAAALKLKLL